MLLVRQEVFVLTKGLNTPDGISGDERLRTSVWIVVILYVVIQGISHLPAEAMGGSRVDDGHHLHSIGVEALYAEASTLTHNQIVATLADVPGTGVPARVWSTGHELRLHGKNACLSDLPERTCASSIWIVGGCCDKRAQSNFRVENAPLREQILVDV